MIKCCQQIGVKEKKCVQKNIYKNSVLIYLF
jgi:hypothetical protein